MKTKLLGVIVLLLVFPRPASAEIEAVAGYDLSLLFSGSTLYGWELAGLYPFVGVNLGGLRLRAHAGGGVSAQIPNFSFQDYALGYFWSEWIWHWTYQFGGTLEFGDDDFSIGIGGGMAGPNLEDKNKLVYPFIRGSVNFDTAKIFLDYNLLGGFKGGILFTFSSSYSHYRPAPPPSPAPVPRPSPAPAPLPPTPARPQEPRQNPTITPEELRRVELAYAETVRDIERRERRLYIHNRTERAAFIQRYQGRPDTGSANMARNEKLPYFNSRVTSEQDIVRQTRAEPNPFLKVRMIHDWVTDTFSYDYDLLWWMDNVSGRNEVFTLGELVKRERGVCFEYAILFWFLMDAAGVETYLVSDFSQPGIGHAYNMVVINGTGYIIDATWDSGNWYQNNKIIKFDRLISKDYFMPGISESYRLRKWQ